MSFAACAALPGASSVAVVLDLEQRERAQDMRRGDRRRRVQIGPVELGKRARSKQAETALDLILQQLEQTHDTGFASRRQGIALHAADAHQIRSARDRLDDVAAAAE